MKQKTKGTTTISDTEREDLIATLKNRFEKNKKRHKDISWEAVEKKLRSDTAKDKLTSLQHMEDTGGEPDVVAADKDKLVFMDCAAESPKGRRSLCYDREAWNSRKEHKPQSNVLDTASEMGIELLDEEQYRYLQTLGEFDAKTSTWLKTPPDIRKLGGAIFGDFRYGKVFIYHNGAESYYAARGFRGAIVI